ncbi:SCO0930 family lipoprotein [Streptomyces sp. NRRL S-241]|uniref:SCO0930 family lipoprotein n=1 Tax=Streptomyces sp. NRRL S-241 TaxID=1463896 RepID=UPI0004C236B6|nr:SCO0930 family lipoprotein [Streptomyces sp. NRRL S-241]
MRREIFAVSAVAVLMMTAACGSSDNYGGKAPAVQPVGDSKQAGSADDIYGGGAGGGAVPAGQLGKTGPAGQMKVSEIQGLGAAVTDSEGFTLYRFDKDTPKPPKSNCEGDCAATWPAVAAEGASVSAGIDAALLGSVERSDGTKQLTVAGWPVYRYAKDAKAGDALGEGVGGTWHALGPGGKPAGKGAAAGAEKEKEEEKKEDKPAEEAKASGLTAVQNPELGTLVEDAEGKTLYRFDKDSAWPMKIGCVDACTDTWKPAKPVDKANVNGVAPELIGKVKRPDGTEQLTIDCWPVYTFTGDKEPGDTTGHNNKGLWFAITDKGKKAKVVN